MPRIDDDWLKTIVDPIIEQPTCTDHRGQFWCNHLREYIHEGRDASVLQRCLPKLWTGSDPIAAEDGPVNIAIPVIPGEGEWLWVAVYQWAPNLYTVMCADNFAKVGVDLGALGPGDGRLSVFYMFHDWLLNSGAQCKSDYHGYTAERTWVKAMQSSDTKLREYWTVYQHGLCSSCRQATDMNFEDLVPDIEQKSWGDYDDKSSSNPFTKVRPNLTATKGISSAGSLGGGWGNITYTTPSGPQSSHPF